MEEDLNKINQCRNAAEFLALLNTTINNSLTEDYWKITLPNDLATSAPRSPSLFSYYAALNLLGSKVLFSNLKVSDLLDPANKAKKSAVERHHLFPKEYLNRIGITEQRDQNQIANFALIEWNDNIAILDAPPSDYFPKFIDRFKNDPLLKEMLRVHALQDGWQNLDYFEFLESRRKLIAEIIREGFKQLNENTSSL